MKQNLAVGISFVVGAGTAVGVTSALRKQESARLTLTGDYLEMISRLTGLSVKLAAGLSAATSEVMDNNNYAERCQVKEQVLSVGKVTATIHASPELGDGHFVAVIDAHTIGARQLLSQLLGYSELPTITTRHSEHSVTVVVRVVGPEVLEVIKRRKQTFQLPK